MSKRSETKSDKPSFAELARELGCDPNDPRVTEALKVMATQPPKPHGKGVGTDDKEAKPKKG